MSLKPQTIINKHFETIKHNVRMLGNTTAVKHADNKIISERQIDDITFKLHTSDVQHLYGNLNNILLLPKLITNKGYYEMIVTYPFKIYFDIDGKNKPSNYLDKILTKISEVFKDADIAISGSETALKKSYHLVLNNYLINNINERNTLKRLANFLKETFDDGFDDVVYREKGLMKMINQSKPDDKRIQRIINFNDGKIEYVIPLTDSQIKNEKTEPKTDVKQLTTEEKKIQQQIIRRNFKKHIITSFFNKNTKTINDISYHIPSEPEPKPKTEPKPKPEQTEKTEINEDIKNESLIIQLLNILDHSRANNNIEFFKIGCLIKTLV